MVRTIGYFVPGSQPTGFIEEAVDVPAVGALERHPLDRRERELSTRARR